MTDQSDSNRAIVGTPREKERLELSDREVTKTFMSTRDADIEYLKSSKGLHIGQDSGLFRVPAINSRDAQSMKMERLDDIKPLYTILNTDTGAQLCEKAGLVLAVIHERMKLTDEYCSTIAPPFDQPEPVFFHGDYNPVNVQYHTGSHALVVLDWNTPYWTGSAATIGSRYWDIAVFLMYLFNQRIGSAELVKKPESAASRFLAGYESTWPLDKTILREFAIKVLDYHLRAAPKSIPHRIARAPYLFRYKQFLKRIFP